MGARSSFLQLTWPFPSDGHFILPPLLAGVHPHLQTPLVPGSPATCTPGEHREGPSEGSHLREWMWLLPRPPPALLPPTLIVGRNVPHIGRRTSRDGSGGSASPRVDFEQWFC